MNLLTKYDVLIYLGNGATQIDEIIRQIRQNLLFEKTSERRIRLILAELRKDGLVSRNRRHELMALTSRAMDTLAFLLRARRDDLDYRVPLKKKHREMFQ